jgi:hypothetical protein
VINYRNYGERRVSRTTYEFDVPAAVIVVMVSGDQGGHLPPIEIHHKLLRYNVFTDSKNHLGFLLIDECQHLLPIIRIDDGGFAGCFVDDEVHPVIRTSLKRVDLHFEGAGMGEE